MPQQDKKYTVMYVPRSGLFFSGGAFFDGHQNRIPWRHVIPVYRSHSAACVARDRVRERWKNAEGEFVVMPVEFEGGEHAFEEGGDGPDES
jgi:hypothetical protein